MWKPMRDPQDYNECHRTAHRDPKTVRRYQEDKVWNGQRAPFCFSLFEKPGQSTIFFYPESDSQPNAIRITSKEITQTSIRKRMKKFSSRIRKRSSERLSSFNKKFVKALIMLSIKGQSQKSVSVVDEHSSQLFNRKTQKTNASQLSKA
jgi:hypothetical protein